MAHTSPPQADRSAHDLHVRGLTFVFVAGLLYSSAGLFTRGLPFDPWTLVAWRCLSGGVFSVLLVAGESRRLSLDDYRMGLWRWTLVPIGAASTICYIFALKITTVANVMIVYATTPFVTAIVAWIWLREVPSRRLTVASSVALLGVAIMLLGGGGGGGSLMGTAMVLFMNVSFALSLVAARRHPERSMTPVNTLSLLLASLVSFAFAPSETMGPGSYAALLAFGIVTIGIALPLFMAGARLAPSAEVALIGISDVVLGPLMMWLVFRENPSTAAVAGGAVVMVALAWNIWPEARRALRARRPRDSGKAGPGFI